jgi:hypothetical protein
MSLLITLLIGLAWGLGLALVVFAGALFYRVFQGNTQFNNPLIPMGLSFAFSSVGVSFLYTAIVYST